jgi:hypothetical protein
MNGYVIYFPITLTFPTEAQTTQLIMKPMPKQTRQNSDLIKKTRLEQRGKEGRFYALCINDFI